MKVYILMEDRFHAPSSICGVYESEEDAFEERQRILATLEFPFEESFRINSLIYEFEMALKSERNEGKNKNV